MQHILRQSHFLILPPFSTKKTAAHVTATSERTQTQSVGDTPPPPPCPVLTSTTASPTRHPTPRPPPPSAPPGRETLPLRSSKVPALAATSAACPPFPSWDCAREHEVHVRHVTVTRKRACWVRDGKRKVTIAGPAGAANCREESPGVGHRQGGRDVGRRGRGRGVVVFVRFV